MAGMARLGLARLRCPRAPGQGSTGWWLGCHRLPPGKASSVPALWLCAGHHKPEDPNQDQTPSSVPRGPQPRGAGGSAGSVLCSRALWLAKLPQPRGAEAVCLQLDRSSASPACLLRFLILGVGLSKSRAEPPRDQGEAGGALSSKFLFFSFFPPPSLCTQSRAVMKLHPCLACSAHARHTLQIIVLGGALRAAGI